MEVQDNKIVVFYVPIPTEQEAKSIAAKLLKNKHAVCANIIPRGCSMYAWQGGVIEEASECVLILKTANRLQSTVEQFIKDYHPYECPAIISCNVRANIEFVKWLESGIY